MKTIRKSLPLTEREQHDLELLRVSEERRQVLADLTNQEPAASEAKMLHAIYALGMSTLSERIDEIGYAQMAAQEGREEKDERRVMARRALARMTE